MKDLIGQLLKKFVPLDDTNLSNAPMRYMDQSSRYNGDPPASHGDVWGSVDPDLPHLVNITSDQSYDDWVKTLAHEGTHSKLTIANLKKKLPELDPNLRDNIDYLLETDPEFLKEYVGHESEYRPYKDIQPSEINDRLKSVEISAYLQAMEARMPRGQMIENSKWGKSLFPTENDVNKYLNAVIPEGYIRNNTSSFTPTPTYERMSSQRVAPRGILQVISDLMK